MEFLYNYGLFLAKTSTFLIAFMLIVGMLVNLRGRKKSTSEGEFQIEKVNDRFDTMEEDLKNATLPKDVFKKYLKERKKTLKEQEKSNVPKRKNIFVLFFDGDIRASEVDFLREEITALLTIATPNDEVFLMLESSGGMVHSYGLAAAQLLRLRERGISITASVDRVAASGGYMMACVANTIIAAPFAVIGSIGVIAQLPNFNRLLKKHDVDYEQISAGQYKRTLTVFGQNTDKARAKFQEEVNDTHELFKDFVKTNRKQLDIDAVSTGEHWYGQRALNYHLIDRIQTSDDYLLSQRDKADIYEVTYSVKESLTDKVSAYISLNLEKWGIVTHNYL